VKRPVSKGSLLPLVDQGFPSPAIPAAPSRTERRKQSIWDRRLGELLEYRKTFGHVNVPRGWAENYRLANWVGNQRRLVRLERLSEERLRRLEELGISWGGSRERQQAQQEAWERMFGALRAFRRAHGHLIVPRRWPVEPQLSTWLTTQRFLHRSQALAESRLRKLIDLDPQWHVPPSRVRKASKSELARENRAESWERRLSDLMNYRERHGDCSVPCRWPADPKLACWVANQRSLRRRGRLSPQRIGRLDRLGFEWSGERHQKTQQDLQWETQFAALSEFMRAQGHSSVPLDWPENRRLGIWVFRQRNEHRQGRLREDRRLRLEGLKFSWNPRESAGSPSSRRWDQKYDALLTYGRNYGHLNLADVEPHRALFRWLEGQRRRQRRGLLSPDRARRLEEAGVSWSPRDGKWETRFAELVEYRRSHGDCAIDMSGAENPRLSRWVSAQRADRKSGRLEGSRLQRLDAIGFLWEAPRVRRSPSASPLR